jgi:HSP20 family protein
MFPFDKSKPIRKPSMSGFGDSFFAEFEDEMNRMMAQAENASGQSFVYGYSAYTGEDGKTHVNEYSNVPGFRGMRGGQIAGAQPAYAIGGRGTSAATPAPAEGAVEPYYDVLDEGETIKVIVEMPGVEKKDIKVQAHGRHVDVNAECQHHRYAAEIAVPDYVEAKPRKAQYINGILEITYGKDEKPSDVAVE